MIPNPPVPEVRNLTFDVEQKVPRHWHGGRRSVTLFFDNLSIFFPAGERFFLKAVKEHRRFVEDPALLAAVRGFSAQEGVHTREHERYNRMLRDHGYPVEEMEARVERILARVTRISLPRWRLAATCALEHFTALLADMLLGDSELLDGAHPEMAALWRWHAAEENEHKAVAYDVYAKAGGFYLERVVVMALATVIFWGKVLEHQVRLMHADGIVWDPREWLALVDFLCFRPGGMLGLLPHYLAYYRPGFHPWDHDNRALLEGYLRAL